MMLTKVNFQKDVESFTHLLERETKFRLSVLGGGSLLKSGIYSQFWDQILD